MRKNNIYTFDCKNYLELLSNLELRLWHTGRVIWPISMIVLTQFYWLFWDVYESLFKTFVLGVVYGSIMYSL